jgi:hypothetical protein
MANERCGDVLERSGTPMVSMRRVEGAFLSMGIHGNPSV